MTSHRINRSYYHAIFGVIGRFRFAPFGPANLPVGRTADGARGDGIPTDARYKPGSGGQQIAFVPSLDLIITRQTGASGAWQFAEYLRRACAAVAGE